MNDHFGRLTVSLRRHVRLMDAVRTLVASAPQSPEAVSAWRAITTHHAVDEAVTRDIVYESALELAMPFHARRIAHMEGE